MAGYISNVEKDTLENDNFRKVVFTAPSSQLVLMSLLPKEEIGEEVHTLDQFFRIESGEGRAVLDGGEFIVGDGSAIVVPAGTKHNLINVSETAPLKLYTIYSPAQHKDGVVHKTKAEAELDESDHV